MDQQNQLTPEQNKVSELDRRERQRQSMDQILVKNILNEKFRVVYDGISWIVSPLAKRVFPRYLAKHFTKKLTDYILITKADQAIEEENKRRIEKGMSVMTKYHGGEQQVFEGQFKVNNPHLRRDLYKQIWLGIFQEYGLDEIAPEPEAESGLYEDDDSVFLDSLDARVEMTDDEPIHTPKKKTMEAKKNDVVSEVEE